MNRVPKKERLERLSRMIESSLGLGCLTMNVLHSCLVGWPRFAFIRRLRFAGCFATSRIYCITAQIGGGKPRSCRLGFPGFAVRRTKSSLFFVPAAGAGGGRCFEKIRTSCVYVWHRWRLEQTAAATYSDLMKWNSALGGILWLGRLISAVYDVVLSPIITSAPKSPP